MHRALILSICVSLLMLPLAQASRPKAPPPVAPKKTVVTAPVKKAITAAPRTIKPAQAIAKQLQAANKAVRASVATARPEARRPMLTRYVDRLPKRDQGAIRKLLQNPKMRTSVPLQRAVAAVLVLRGLKGGQRLPVSLADLHAMSSSPSWTAKRMQNLAMVLRHAASIAAVEGIGANAAFQKALKAYGIQKKFNQKVCGV
jgi:hypothetical protein